jgi:hypothetical protein
MGQPAEKYGRLLSDLHSHLTQYGERQWTPILRKWLDDLEQLERVQTPISGYRHICREPNNLSVEWVASMTLRSLLKVDTAFQVGKVAE